MVILRLLKRKLPKYDYVFLGDTKNLPYGNKTQEQIFRLTVNAVEYLFKRDCALVIVACNTASSQALRKIQQELLPRSKYRDRKVLGIIRPTVEDTVILSRMTVGIIGTKRTIDSKAYIRELAKQNAKVKILQKATPKLVQMIEAGSMGREILENYLSPFKSQKIDALILACTHYGLLKHKIRKILGKKVKVIAQEELLPAKLKSYLTKHTEIDRVLSKSGKLNLLTTMLNPQYRKLAKHWFGKGVKLILVNY